MIDMKHRTAIVLPVWGCLALVLAGVPTVEAEDNPAVATARKARDQAEIESLRKVIDQAHSEAQQHGTAEAYERLAQFELWLCEAAHGHNDEKLLKQAAEVGVAAAEKAVALNPNSSEAHRIEGEAIGELIPHVFAGGMRYGRRSTAELDKAIELDPRNANAYIGRAIAYFFTPAAFGGSRDKAMEMLKKAIELDPSSDTAHIWLAQVYFAKREHAEAVREINEARRLDPERVFATHVYNTVTATRKQQANAN
jgi:tetratricopeptide (TPR) repeat protein